MAYTVLARRYRSRNFDELVGQEAIATTLKNAIQSGRVAHAYLFTGTRGTGKTSTARILAKALNCEKGPTPEPDSTCPICQDIARGEDVDVIEIDGASNTSVEDIRQLRSNAIYRPARARFKIYIIDEVHMISTSAFNALLKTLEEPPEHVKFIFATTEPNRVPITIQSRCQRFDFKPIPKSQIAGQIRKILAAEKVEADAAVVERVARLANGSMRDALSLLDQLLSMGKTTITAELADQFLPVAPVDQYAKMIDAALVRDAAGVLKQADAILSAGSSPGDFCLALSEYLRDLMVVAAGAADPELLLSPENIHGKLFEQAKAVKPLSWSFAITVVEELARSVKFSQQARTLIDAAMVTLTYLPDLVDVQQPVSATTGPTNEPAKKKSTPFVNLSASLGSREPFKSPAPTSDKPISPHHAALAEPIVRKVIEVFEGRLVDVKPVVRK